MITLTWIWTTRRNHRTLLQEPNHLGASGRAWAVARCRFHGSRRRIAYTETSTAASESQARRRRGGPAAGAAGDASRRSTGTSRVGQARVAGRLGPRFTATRLGRACAARHPRQACRRACRRAASNAARVRCGDTIRWSPGDRPGPSPRRRDAARRRRARAVAASRWASVRRRQR